MGQGLLTDLYQITMANAYWKSGLGEREAVFHLYFRRNPFGGGYAVAAGLAAAIDFLDSLTFDEEDLAYLAELQGNDGGPLFDREFLTGLRTLHFDSDLDAVSEGTVVFEGEPLLRVRGPIIQCQLVETALLNLVNFQTLVATKAARVCLAAGGDPVLEFGLRRAQGPDGGVSASRAAYLGGCAATSNVLAGKRFGIPLRGTHAHSWIMAFDSEKGAFEAWAEAMPNNCVFLVDTYDTLQGVRLAAKAGERLRERGHELAGARLDSGDLAELSVAARQLLDASGFPKAEIVASNDLDEHAIEELKRRGAAISVWGVGTRLATAHDDPALGGVFKLGALRDGAGRWTYPIKHSADPEKSTLPGIHQTRRFLRGRGFLRDLIFDEELGTDQSDEPYEDILGPVLRSGRLVEEPPTLDESRARALDQLARLPAGTRRLVDPDPYPVEIDARLAARTQT
jgi:nicotinate phosphoribosyltransferase